MVLRRFNFVLRNFIVPITLAYCAVMSLYFTFARCVWPPLDHIYVYTNGIYFFVTACIDFIRWLALAIKNTLVI